MIKVSGYACCCNAGVRCAGCIMADFVANGIYLASQEIAQLSTRRLLESEVVAIIEKRLKGA